MILHSKYDSPVKNPELLGFHSAGRLLPIGGRDRYCHSGSGFYIGCDPSKNIGGGDSLHFFVGDGGRV